MKVAADLDHELRAILDRWSVNLDVAASAEASRGQPRLEMLYSVVGPLGRVGPPGTYAGTQRFLKDLIVAAVADLIAARVAQTEHELARKGEP